MAALLEVRGLEIRLPVSGGTLHAVRGIDFDIAAGETLCLVGESGCGKSLTALAVLGLLPRRAERRAKRLAFDGQDLLALSSRAMADLRGTRIAMIFQDPMTALNPTLTVGRQLVEGMMRHERVTEAAARARAVELLGRVGIADPAARLGQHPHQFSGGQRQRIMIAIALMCRPELLIADEPTTALDVTIQAQILSLLDELKQELGLGLMLITHDLGIVGALADRVVVMYAGAAVEQGPVRELFERPSHPYTRGLLGAIPVPGETAPGSRLRAIPGRVPELIGGITGCAFRDRCGFAAEACAIDPLPDRTLEAGHRYVCVLPPEAAAVPP